eukprot:403347174
MKQTSEVQDPEQFQSQNFANKYSYIESQANKNSSPCSAQSENLQNQNLGISQTCPPDIFRESSQSSLMFKSAQKLKNKYSKLSSNSCQEEFNQAIQDQEFSENNLQDLPQSFINQNQDSNNSVVEIQSARQVLDNNQQLNYNNSYQEQALLQANLQRVKLQNQEQLKKQQFMGDQQQNEESGSVQMIGIAQSQMNLLECHKNIEQKQQKTKAISKEIYDDMRVRYGKLKRKFRYLSEEYTKLLDEWEETSTNLKSIMSEKKFLKKKLEAFYRNKHLLEEEKKNNELQNLIAQKNQDQLNVENYNGTEGRGNIFQSTRLPQNHKSYQNHSSKYQQVNPNYSNNPQNVFQTVNMNKMRSTPDFQVPSTIGNQFNQKQNQMSYGDYTQNGNGNTGGFSYKQQMENLAKKQIAINSGQYNNNSYNNGSSSMRGSNYVQDRN